jgi:hypothetical protein
MYLVASLEVVRLPFMVCLIAKVFGILKASYEVIGKPLVMVYNTANLFGILEASCEEVIGKLFKLTVYNLAILKASLGVLGTYNIANTFGILPYLYGLPLLVNRTCIMSKSARKKICLAYVAIWNLVACLCYRPVSTVCACIGDVCLCRTHIGGYKPHAITFADIEDYVIGEISADAELTSSRFQFIAYLDASNSAIYVQKQYIQVQLPLHILVTLVPLGVCRKIATEHGMVSGSHTTLPMMKSLFEGHTCEKCSSHFTIFAVQPSKKEHKKTQRKNAEQLKTLEEKDMIREQARIRMADHCKQRDIANFEKDPDSIFPPVPLDKGSSQEVINGACKKLDQKLFEEAGCAVCGQLIPVSELSRLSAVKNYLKLLEAPGVTRQERLKISGKVREYPSALDHSCKHICNSCRSSL